MKRDNLVRKMMQNKPEHVPPLMERYLFIDDVTRFETI